LVAVIGASGSGKSSLVAAGLLPRLAGGAIPGSRDWLAVRFTPAMAGSDPFRSLRAELDPLLAGAGYRGDAWDRLRSAVGQDSGRRGHV
jgi:energy-coupling factor transporter ATP-binding protein EcfA2